MKVFESFKDNVKEGYTFDTSIKDVDLENMLVTIKLGDEHVKRSKEFKGIKTNFDFEYVFLPKEINKIVDAAGNLKGVIETLYPILKNSMRDSDFYTLRDALDKTVEDDITIEYKRANMLLSGIVNMVVTILKENKIKIDNVEVYKKDLSIELKDKISRETAEIILQQFKDLDTSFGIEIDDDFINVNEDILNNINIK